MGFTFVPSERVIRVSMTVGVVGVDVPGVVVVVVVVTIAETVPLTHIAP